MRIGLGYDTHRLVDGRSLVLGGVTIPFSKGLLGHSDADVLTHAICDALLGAAGMGDIGTHFPDSDPQFKDIYSIILLERTNKIIQEKGFRIVNLDTTIFAEAPKLIPHRMAMQETLAKALSLQVDQINIKATTAEGLGMVGNSECMNAMCIALLSKFY